jgi:site-specific DNA-methyltransferase (adenine-specific)
MDVKSDRGSFMIELLHGDCLELMKDIPDKSIDLTVTSPPYDNLRTYNNTLVWDESIWRAVIKELYRIAKDGGVVVWVVGDATIKGSETGTSFKQALYFKECGFNLHDTMIYEKGGQGATGSNKCYLQNFEYMFILSKGLIKTVNKIKDRKNVRQKLEKINSTKRKINGNIALSKYRQGEEYGYRFNIWKITNGGSSAKDKDAFKHPAIFPEQLANDHIISWSNEGDMVLDCFMGSGTTGKMALLNNRNFIGIEKDEKYFEIAKNRIEQARQDAEHKLF